MPLAGGAESLTIHHGHPKTIPQALAWGVGGVWSAFSVFFAYFGQVFNCYIQEETF